MRKFRVEVAWVSPPEAKSPTTYADCGDQTCRYAASACRYTSQPPLRTIIGTAQAATTRAARPTDRNLSRQETHHRAHSHSGVQKTAPSQRTPALIAHITPIGTIHRLRPASTKWVRSASVAVSPARATYGYATSP